MKWEDISEEKVLQRAFYLGVIGIMFSLIPIIYFNFSPGEVDKISLLNGIGLAAQFLALSMAILVLRKLKVKKEYADKAKRMIIVLAVSLLFFFLV